MTDENPNIIPYTNWLMFEGRKLAFRKQELFDITSTPKWIEYNEVHGYWLIGKKQLTKKRAKELTVKEIVEVDVSNLQWYEQEKLRGVFNLC